ncbi:hypothetical protein M427DRAFT_68755 [Gonapodya prolifera JEL478]|uniref:Uncharacterized protein n=1 Tax=Gonapodya prolifera (strain JEL478) TaxID=1344416 RepID=A0A139AKS1_GONPJ|nr:hypothetical protein M427DRAFT_68755 [Gonapodya prolifera JEL478]|eukprot:KXS17025.1 hypothetical protein M427DRAFT_68755 [Gonapodya prolifera JEL478]
MPKGRQANGKLLPGSTRTSRSVASRLGHCDRKTMLYLFLIPSIALAVLGLFTVLRYSTSTSKSTPSGPTSRLYHLDSCAATGPGTKKQWHEVTMYDTSTGPRTSMSAPRAVFNSMTCVNPDPTQAGGNCIYEDYEDLGETVNLDFAARWQRMATGGQVGYAAINGGPLNGRKVPCFKSVKMGAYSDKSKKCTTIAFCTSH